MHIAVNKIATVLFRKPLNECSADELRQLTHQYPYFGPAQLLLAKKLSPGSDATADNSSIYEEQVQKASLYFPNRVWLHHMLNDTGIHEMVYYDQPITEAKVLVTETEQSNPEPSITEEKVWVTEAEQGNPEPSISEEKVWVTEAEQGSPEPFIEPVVNEYKEPETAAEPVEEEKVDEAAVPLELPQLKIEPLPSKDGLTFEPYHTVDYFASQGIKFREDEKPKDRFSEQLKSFTEWLKTMKRIPASEIPTAGDAVIERKVDQMAELSLAERHVITEAMAEVWIKQGNRAKAEEIYRKLSLLDPLKSSYFATKIEDIKKMI